MGSTFDNSDNHRRMVSDTLSPLTPSSREDRWDTVMEDFEKQLDQIAKEYRKSLEDYDYNNELTQELEKSRATIEQLNQLVARERETSEELKKKVAEVVGQLSTQKRQETLEKDKLRERLREKDQLLSTSEKAKGEFEKEIADLKKQLKEKVGAEVQSLRTQNEQPGETKTNSASVCSSNNSLAGKTVKLRQYYNSFTKDHFYRSDWAELEGLKNGYTYKGVVGHVFQSPLEGAIPLYRYWNERMGKHLYTTGWSDAIDLNKMGYVYETISCYIFSSWVEGTRGLVRYYNFEVGDHFLTTDLEVFGMGKNGFIKDRVLGYVF